MFTNIKKTFNRAILKVKKYSPEICVVAGIITGGAALVVACKETINVESIREEAKEKLDKIKENEPIIDSNGEPVEKMYEDEDGEAKPYTVEVAKRDKLLVYIQTAVKFTKNYAPAALLSAVSIALILGGFGILKKRHIALTAAYAGLNTSYKNYRNRIADKYGKNVDRETLLLTEKETEVKENVDEKGNVKVEENVKTTVNKPENDDSDYIRLFSQNAAPHTWRNDPSFNLTFLRQTEQYANAKLKSRGHLFLNEVYDALGMSHTKVGALCGWVVGTEGDDYVSFGISPEWLDDVLSRDDSNYWLEFNCQGIIYDKI